MERQLPARVNEILSLYFEQINNWQSDFIQGFYIYGSLSLGHFSLELSDIDFVAITKERLKDKEIARLEQIHHQIERHYAKPNLNGIYITWNDLGK